VLQQLEFFGSAVSRQEEGCAMAPAGSYKNVFDDKSEFDKLQGLIQEAVSRFSEYRQGNLTYGEVMYVMECLLDGFRTRSEQDTKTRFTMKGLHEAPTFRSLMSITGRMVETLAKKGIINSTEEAYILHGAE
jgi:hypothetical protein